LRVEHDGTLLATLSGGSLNPRAQTEAQLTATLTALWADLRRALGSDLAGTDLELRAGFVGCAGADRDAEKALLTRIFREKLGFTGRLGLGNDAETVLAGAIASGVGTVLIAGTGSFAWSRSDAGGQTSASAARGQTSRCGGYGHLLGDEGSAWWLGREGLRQSILEFEATGASPLLAALLAHAGLATPQQLIPWVYQDFQKSRVAALARVVDAERERGDPLAVALFENAAADLVALAVRARRSMSDPNDHLVLHGGLLEGNPWYQQRCRADLEREGFVVVGPGTNAALGACRLARRLLTGS
jgi:N-acetylglucosamine kinase-like BadF-type ATPase